MIKTIERYNVEDFDKAVNDFEALQGGRVFATQTHVNYDVEYHKLVYTAIVFYRPSGSVLK